MIVFLNKMLKDHLMATATVSTFESEASKKLEKEIGDDII